MTAAAGNETGMFVILTKFSSLVAPQVVEITTQYGAVSDENILSTLHFHFSVFLLAKNVYIKDGFPLPEASFETLFSSTQAQEQT